MTDEERKIFIDEDWKSQVEREKEEARKKGESKAEPEAKVEGEQAPDAAEEPEAPEEELEANPFLGLVNSLAAQCMLALGVIAPRDAKQVTVDIEQAKYLIDTLMMLREKTKGNLTQQEEAYLSETLSELQRGYVVRAQQAQEAAFKQAGVDPNNLKQ